MRASFKPMCIASEDEIDRLRGRQKGTITVAVSPLASTLIIPAVLPPFCVKYADIEVKISEGIYPPVLAPLRDGVDRLCRWSRAAGVSGC